MADEQVAHNESSEAWMTNLTAVQVIFNSWVKKAIPPDQKQSFEDNVERLEKVMTETQRENRRLIAQIEQLKAVSAIEPGDFADTPPTEKRDEGSAERLRTIENRLDVLTELIASVVKDKAGDEPYSNANAVGTTVQPQSTWAETASRTTPLVREYANFTIPIRPVTPAPTVRSAETGSQVNRIIQRAAPPERGDRKTDERRVVRGVGETTTIKGVSPTIRVLASNFELDTTAVQVRQYLAEKGVEVRECMLLQPKGERQTKSFFVRAAATNEDFVYSDCLWPMGVFVREWRGRNPPLPSASLVPVPSRVVNPEHS